LALASVASLIVGAGGCATTHSLPPTPVFASWSGAHSPTAALFGIIDRQVRAEPGFRRNIEEGVEVHLFDGLPMPAGDWRYQVRITAPSRFVGRRIRPRDQTLAEFTVTCTVEQPQPCADQIIARAHLEAKRLAKIAARSPRATDRNRAAPQN
jgi:hypothetical protein